MGFNHIGGKIVAAGFFGGFRFVRQMGGGMI